MNGRTLLKQTLFSGARLVGVNRLLRYRTRKRLLVLCYHGVVVDSHPDDELRFSTTVSTDEFREQLRILNQTFHCVGPDDVRDWLAGRQDLPPSPVLVTFDDGFRNNLTHAAPELARQSTPALLFVATGYIGTDRVLWPQELVERVLRWPRQRIPAPSGPDLELSGGFEQRSEVARGLRSVCKQVPQEERASYLDQLRQEPTNTAEWDQELYAFLSWDEVREIRRYGVDIGSHTVEHPILSQISAEQLRQELLQSKRTIERELQQPCDYIAYPNGTYADYNQQVLQAVRDAGYSLGFTLNRSLNRQTADPVALDRVDIAGHVPLEVFRSRVSGLFTLLDSLRNARR